MKSIKPNVLWFFANQLKCHNWSCNRDKNREISNIDHLGTRFTNACSQYPDGMPFIRQSKCAWLKGNLTTLNYY